MDAIIQNQGDSFSRDSSCVATFAVSRFAAYFGAGGASGMASGGLSCGVAETFGVGGELDDADSATASAD